MSLDNVCNIAMKYEVNLILQFNCSSTLVYTFLLGRLVNIEILDSKTTLAPPSPS